MSLARWSKIILLTLLNTRKKMEGDQVSITGQGPEILFGDSLGWQSQTPASEWSHPQTELKHTHTHRTVPIPNGNLFFPFYKKRS